jgi:type 1 glutamine amidotransferase
MLIVITMTSFYHCNENSKMKVLIITGGHDFERDAFFDMFDSFTEIEYKEVVHPEANQSYASPMIDSVDVLIFYDMMQEISDQQKEDLLKLLDRGKSLLFLHHSLASYQKWDEFKGILGGKYHKSEEMTSTSHTPGSTYKHDVQVPVTIVDGKHDITAGIDNFVIRDETYGGYSVSPDVYPLLTTTEETSGEILGWINHYKKSWIVYLQLGHDHYAYENPNYRRLVQQSIRWLAHPQP